MGVLSDFLDSVCTVLAGLPLHAWHAPHVNLLLQTLLLSLFLISLRGWGRCAGMTPQFLTQQQLWSMFAHSLLAATLQSVPDIRAS